MNSGHRVFPPLSSTPFSFKAAEEAKPASQRQPVMEDTLAIPVAPSPVEIKSAVTAEDAEKAVRTLLRWIGDDPERPDLKETPARVAKAWKEFFSGYSNEAATALPTGMSAEGMGRDMICAENIPVVSFCEHHLVPFRGRAFIAYLPGQKIAGFGGIARLVDRCAHRLQIQERLTHQIAKILQDTLQPRGVAVAIVATHECMAALGPERDGAELLTLSCHGLFETDSARRAEFLSIVRNGR